MLQVFAVFPHSLKLIKKTSYEKKSFIVITVNWITNVAIVHMLVKTPYVLGTTETVSVVTLAGLKSLSLAAIFVN